MKKTIFDDGFQAYLTEGAELDGEPGIPMLLDMGNTQIPRDLLSFGKALSCRNHRQYVHFYMHDREFSRVLTATTRYLDLIKTYDGIITPDCSMAIGQAPCLQQANTYMNRAVGYFFQKQGVPVIPNIRWSDESSFAYCFLGVPKHSIVCVSTHGCIRNRQQRKLFRTGLEAMIYELKPRAVLVHGYMPDDIFGDFKGYVEFRRYPSEFERTHSKAGE